jgi:MFS transporter, putative metabolite:H+ symporter
MQIEVPLKQNQWLVISAILVSALGYFVDLYDLFIINVVRTESLTSLGVAQKDLPGFL